MAAFAASSMADVGFGVQAAAEQFGLDFVELAYEHYLLIYRQDRLPQTALDHLTALLRDLELVQRINKASDYQPDQPGQITRFDELRGQPAITAATLLVNRASYGQTYHKPKHTGPGTARPSDTEL